MGPTKNVGTKRVVYSTEFHNVPQVPGFINRNSKMCRKLRKCSKKRDPEGVKK